MDIHKDSKIDNKGNENIGIVDNTGNITINTYNNLSTEQKNTIDQKIYLKCDRADTINDLKDILEDNETFDKPFIVFLPGYLDDEHNLATKKIEYTLNLQLEAPTIYMRIDDWDTAKKKDKQLRRLKRSLREAFERYVKNKKGIHEIDFPSKIDNGKELLKLPHIKQQILVIEQDIDLEQWNDNIALNLEYFIRKFWNFDLDENSQPVFILYNLVYGKRKSLSQNQIEKIAEDLEKIIENHDDENTELFEELNELNRGHIHAFFRDCDICDIENFMQEGETRRMSKVLPQLRKILIEYGTKADDDAIANM